MIVSVAPLLVLLAVLCWSGNVLGKNADKVFLSRCSCDKPTGPPDCDFSKLSKAKLRDLVDKLMTSSLICVQANGFNLPSFSSSLNVFPAGLDPISFKTVSPAGQILESAADKTALEKPKLHEPIGKQSKEIANSGVFVKSVPKTADLDGFYGTTKNGLQLLFPTMVVVQELIRDKQSFVMNEELKRLMLDLEEEDDGCKFNLHGGYRSKDGFLNRQDRSIQWLRNQIIPRVQNLLTIANATMIDFTLEGWGAVLRGGHGQSVHVHPGSMYAGVYYVAAPAEVSATGRSGGCLHFVDPRNGLHMAQVVRGKNIYGEAIEICPGATGGLLVIFPSWLMHEVVPMPEIYNGPRIGISFNVLYKPR